MAADAPSGQTFQSGDTVRNAKELDITVLSPLAAGAVTATLQNVARADFNLVGSGAVSGALWTGVGQAWVTNNTAAGNTLTLTNGLLSTTYGVASSKVSLTYNIGVAASNLVGTTDTLNVALASAGLRTTSAGKAPTTNTVTVINTADGVEAMNIAATGVNVVDIRDTNGSIETLTVTGAATSNRITVNTLSGVETFDLSATTGTNILTVGSSTGNALTTDMSFIGGTGADTLGLGGTLSASKIAVTGFETLSFAASTATVATTGAVAFVKGTSFATIAVTGSADAQGAISLTNVGAPTALNFTGSALTVDASNVQNFAAITLASSFAGSDDTLAINLANGGVALAAGYNVGALSLRGVEAINVDIKDLDSSALATMGTITARDLQTIAFAGTGRVSVTLDASHPSANSLSDVDLSGLTGTGGFSTVTFAAGSLAETVSITASAGGTTLEFGANAGVGGVTEFVDFTGGAGVDTITLAPQGIAFLTANGGGGNDIITSAAGGGDITGGVGADVLTGGAGVDTFIYATGATGNTVATADTINSFVTGADFIQTGVAGLVAAEVLIVDGTTLADFAAFVTAANTAFSVAGGSDKVFVAWNVANISAGNALVAINNNGGTTFTSGDSLIVLTGINLAAEIAVANFIA